MNTQPKKQLRITGCRDSLMWYAGLVGQTVPYLGTWPEGYRSREPAGYINVVRFQDAEVIDVEADSPTNPFPENPPERRTLQAAGEHPTPCARTCEANAFRIEIRRLTAERAALAAKLAELEGQEPAAVVETSGSRGGSISWHNNAELPVETFLFRRPVPAKPVRLTDKEIFDMADDGIFRRNVREITRVVENAVLRANSFGDKRDEEVP